MERKSNSRIQKNVRNTLFLTFIILLNAIHVDPLNPLILSNKILKVKKMLKEKYS